MPLRVALLLVVSLVWTSQSADACRCRQPPPPKESLEQSAAVFLGKVTKIVEVDGQYHVTLSVSLAWKGIKKNVVTVATAQSSAACGFGFQMGKEYIVYAHESDGGLSTNICTRTRAFDGKDKSEIEALGPAAMPPS